MPSEDLHIEFANTFFNYGSLPVLKNVNLTFKKGGFYLIIGPNGGGKTTLLKLLMGLMSPKSGKVVVYGKAPQEQRLKMGYVPQSFLFDTAFPINVEEFVLMGCLSKLTWRGSYPKECYQKTYEALDQVELLALKDRPLGTLSGGQRQRASFARALVSDPEILILDEPTSGLDVEASHFIVEQLKKLKKKKTIIMVSHMISDVIDEVDQIIIVKGETSVITKEMACMHYKLGMYHTR